MHGAAHMFAPILLLVLSCSSPFVFTVCCRLQPEKLTKASQNGKEDQTGLLHTSSFPLDPTSGFQRLLLRLRGKFRISVVVCCPMSNITVDGSTIQPSIPSHLNSSLTSVLKTVLGTLLFGNCLSRSPPYSLLWQSHGGQLNTKTSVCRILLV